MKKASQFFSVKEKDAVEKAVVEAERKTSCEICPIVATSSGRYDRAEDIFGLLIALSAVSVAWIFFQEVRPAQGKWGGGYAWALGLFPILGIFISGFILGSTAATYAPVLKLPFLMRKEMREEVDRSATAAFHQFRMRKTQQGVGILIYISLFEHMVRIDGDDAVKAKLDQSDWDGVRDGIIQGIQQRRACEAFCEAIAKCGELLSRFSPIQPGDRNELPNELHLID